MGCFTARHYDQVKDYLHPQLHSFVNYCKQGNLIDLPLYHGCDKKKNKNGSRKLIDYSQGDQCISPTNNHYWKKTKDKYKIQKKEFTGQDI